MARGDDMTVAWTRYRQLTDDELLKVVETRDPLIRTDIEVELAKRLEEVEGRRETLAIVDEFDVSDADLQIALEREAHSDHEAALLEVIEEFDVDIADLRQILKSSTATQE